MATRAESGPAARDGSPSAEADGRPPGLAALFLAFLGIALAGFGGALPWAHRALVERRRWLDEETFTELLGLAQFLPGPNVINLSVAVGARFRGAPGALAALAGIIGAPFCFALALGWLYGRYGALEGVRGATAGVAAAAAGLIVAMAVKLVRPALRARLVVALPVALAAFVAIGLARLPLHGVLLVLAPLSVALTWLAGRR